jgi:acetyltransferase
VSLLVPELGINASFAHTAASPGKIAFVTQSGGMVTAVLDWAKSRDIGFSHFVSMGNSADVDFGDVLDYLAGEPHTRSILRYIESITDARKFMSAARAAARNKPVTVVKAGRAPEGARAAASHTGALAGADDVYDAAIRRAGMLRVDEIEDLFFAVETLARAQPLRGERMVIMTNGGGPGVMATDSLGRRGGRVASLSTETVQRLDAFLPPTWSHGNPVDIIGDAPVERYLETLKILLDSPDADALLLIHAPSAIVPSERIAEACAPLLAKARKNVLACWLGADAVERARDIFIEAGIPTYDTPEDAVDAFMRMVGYRRNQDQLMETPPSLAVDQAPDTASARRLVDAVLAEGRTILTEPEAKALLAAYDIPVVETLRPIRPEDDPAHHELFSKLKPEDIRFRFFRAVRELPRSDYARYTQIDYDREMAFIATRKGADGHPETLGVVRAVADPDNAMAEFAIVVRSDLKGFGLGSILMDKIIRYCRDRCTGELCGEVLAENRAMQALARKLGFVVTPGSEEGMRSLSLELS